MHSDYCDTDSYLLVDGVSVDHQKGELLSDIVFSLVKGEVACLLGPSGCGKTTLLRSIAGFHSITAGKIALDNSILSLVGSGQSIDVPAERRNIGMVFQDNALFPHLSVLANVMFGLHKKTKSEASSIAREWVARVGLAGRESDMPHELSGGEQQRVALARALAPSPRLVLLDEPFSNLDSELRESLGKEVRDIFKASGTTALLVTHDQQEAFAMADSIGVINNGRLQQWGGAYEVYHQPESRFVADFLGRGVLIAGVIQASSNSVKTVLGSLPLDASVTKQDWQAGSCVDVLLRPDDIIHNDDSLLQARVKSKIFRGAEFLYTLQLDNGEELLSLVPSHHNHAVDEMIGIDLSIEHVVVFSQE